MAGGLHKCNPNEALLRVLSQNGRSLGNALHLMEEGQQRVSSAHPVLGVRGHSPGTCSAPGATAQQSLLLQELSHQALPEC